MTLRPGQTRTKLRGQADNGTVPIATNSFISRITSESLSHRSYYIIERGPINLHPLKHCLINDLVFLQMTVLVSWYA